MARQRTMNKLPTAFTMLLSVAGLTPGLASRRSSLRKFSMRRKSSTSPPQSPASICSPSHSSCELWLLSTLQGVELSMEDRMQLARDIENLSAEGKDALLEFLEAENGAVQCTMENNACKAFLCTAHELNSEVLVDGVLTMVELWTNLHQEIIPTLQAVVYPLKSHRPDFDVRRTVLTAFRERVLSKVLIGAPRITELESMLFTVLLETHSESEDYNHFVALAHRVMGLKEKGDAPIVKMRSKTLPVKSSKRVTWLDNSSVERKKSAASSA